MHADEFRRTLGAFADSPADLDLSRGRLLVQVRDELIEARLFQREGDLWVDEGDAPRRATSWLISRVARLPLLAERILTYVPDVAHFVAPRGRLLDQPDHQVGADDVRTDDAVKTIYDLLDRKLGGTTSVTYLTSDAGEGKTTVINHLAKRQSERYRRKESDWLLVPITLGGRAFLRFDDVVVAGLMNRLRFQLLYFDGFLELVKLGVLVPAFDGFEEMFIESSSGEAVSALGNLVRSLASSGSLLIAARKAYFEYQSLGTQARLLDGMGGEAVAFARVALDRWERSHFMRYAELRSVRHPSDIYDTVAARFGRAHPLLTRAVLVKRLLDVVSVGSTVSHLVDQLGSAPHDYFFQFVNAIVEREATEKWIDRSGEPYHPLLSTAEHHDLLALVAQEMWLAANDSLKASVLDVVAEMYSELTQRTPLVARQITERLKQHSLLTTVSGAGTTYAFDHEDFRKFYLGEALGRALARRDQGELRQFLQPGSLGLETAEAAAHFICRDGANARGIVDAVQGLGAADSPSSFTKENAGLLALRLIDLAGLKDVVLESLAFPPDAIKGLHLTAVTFRKCYFQPSLLDGTVLDTCGFDGCRLERLEIFGSTRVEASSLRATEVGSVILHEQDEHIFDPSAVVESLVKAGFSFPEAEQITLPIVLDEECRMVEKALRVFLRANQVNEAVFRQKFVGRANQFIDVVLPQLLRNGILEEIPYRGAGIQRRYRLSAPMQRLQDALKKSGGSFERFLGQMGQ